MMTNTDRRMHLDELDWLIGSPELPFAVSHTPHIIHDIWTVGQRSIIKSLQSKSSKVYISYYQLSVGLESLGLGQRMIM